MNNTFKVFFSGVTLIAAKIFLFSIFCVVVSVSPTWAVTFYWNANPPEEFVVGYRLYYGTESRYEWGGSSGVSLKRDFTYDFFVDPFFGVECPATSTDYSDCVDLEPGEMVCTPAPEDWPGYQGDIQCTVTGDLPTQVYSSIKAYNIFGAEGDYSQELSHTTPELFVTPISWNTTEYGRVAFFLMALTGLPDNADPVTVSLTGDDTEGMISPSSVTFTGNTDWIKFITVTGVEDTLVDGDIEYDIITTIESEDPDYPLSDPDDITVVNKDNDADAAEVLMYDISNNTSEDGTFALILVKLNSRPTAPVTVFFESDDLTEGTVFPPSLTFSGENGYYQAVVVTGVDDTETDGDIEYHIVSRVESADPNFGALTLADLPIINDDNDIKKIFPWGMFLSAILNNAQ